MVCTCAATLAALLGIQPYKFASSCYYQEVLRASQLNLSTAPHEL